LQILLLTRYGSLGASSRVRFYQYLPALASRGIDVTSAPLLTDRYVASLYAGGGASPALLLAAFVRRIATLVRSRRYDLIWLEGEVFPWLPAPLDRLALRRGVPTVVDLDDAIFHRYDEHPRPAVRRLLASKVDETLRRATVVVAGNDYIAARARRAGAIRVETVPSAVNPEVHRPLAPADRANVTVGWIGTPTTAPYLEPVEPILARLVAEHSAQVVLIGATAGTLAGARATVIPWTLEREPQDLNRFDIGIMPVPDRPFERGKCGYKLIQYMACGRAAVGSPVGANRQIIEHGVNGLLADSPAEWQDALRWLAGRPDVRRAFGEAGRRTVIERYSTTVVLPQLLTVLDAAAGSRT
jgi:glycosyltransferase involved in cell wall biosynthesis